MIWYKVTITTIYDETIRIEKQDNHHIIVDLFLIFMKFHIRIIIPKLKSAILRQKKGPTKSLKRITASFTQAEV